MKFQEAVDLLRTGKWDEYNEEKNALNNCEDCKILLHKLNELSLELTDFRSKKENKLYRCDECDTVSNVDHHCEKNSKFNSTFNPRVEPSFDRLRENIYCMETEFDDRLKKLEAVIAHVICNKAPLNKFNDLLLSVHYLEERVRLLEKS